MTMNHQSGRFVLFFHKPLRKPKQGAAFKPFSTFSFFINEWKCGHTLMRTVLFLSLLTIVKSTCYSIVLKECRESLEDTMLLQKSHYLLIHWSLASLDTCYSKSKPKNKTTSSRSNKLKNEAVRSVNNFVYEERIKKNWWSKIDLV